MSNDSRIRRASPRGVLDFRARLVTATLAQEAARRTVAAFARADVPVMPLKGVLFQKVLYDHPDERFLTDIDLLVHARQLDVARAALFGAGFSHRAYARSFIEQSFFAPNGMVIDLHWKLFGHARYRMSTDDVFRRAAVDDLLFGAPVHLMDPYDILAHLVGKMASDHVISGAGVRGAEVVLVADRFRLEPSKAASHLVDCGLSRAARYALPLVEEAGSSFATEVLRLLPPDAVGHLLAHSARRVAERAGRRSWSASLTGHLVNESLPRAAVGLGAAFVARGMYAYATTVHSARPRP